MMSSANTGHSRQSGERGSYITQGEQDSMLIAVCSTVHNHCCSKLIDLPSAWGQVHRSNFSPGGAPHANTETVEQDRSRVHGQKTYSLYPAR
jgi:hypothetical protein